MKRIAFYLFYDDKGIVDDYVVYNLKCLREHVDTIFVVSNSDLLRDSRTKLEAVADTVYCRENIGFDVWGYKEAMEIYGYNNLDNFDEVILLNYTFFGPIFPYVEMFDWAEKEEVDFWGISEHKEMIPNPFTGIGTLPAHIQSHFIAIRKKLHRSAEFKKYWQDMPMITSYTQSILQHESKFTRHFSSKGYSYSVYVKAEDYPSPYATMIDIEAAMKSRCPIFKRRALFHDPMWFDGQAINIHNALDVVTEKSDYDVGMIWENALRSTPPKILSTNLDMFKIFDSNKVVDTKPNDSRIAVLAHVYYPEMIEEIIAYTDNIPQAYHLYVTTGTEKSKKEILDYFMDLENRPEIVEVIVVEQNRGRDIGSLLISCKDICTGDKYDYICRVHSKKSPQNSANASNFFKSHMFDNLLDSKNYVGQLLNFMDDNPHVGMLMPPMIHFGYPTLGHAWFANKPGAQKWANKLGINVPFDKTSPHAAYGTMFWFRPDALKRLFEYDWKWTDFPAEPAHLDGGLAHIIERLLTYSAHNDGYAAYTVQTTKNAERSYTKLEYKFNALMSELSNGDVNWQIHQVRSMKLNSLHGCLSMAIGIFKGRVHQRHPRMAKMLKIPYGALRAIYRVIFRK